MDSGGIDTSPPSTARQQHRHRSRGGDDGHDSSSRSSTPIGRTSKGRAKETSAFWKVLEYLKAKEVEKIEKDVTEQLRLSAVSRAPPAAGPPSSRQLQQHGSSVRVGAPPSVPRPALRPNPTPTGTASHATNQEASLSISL
jgi:hypothetical protein